ncbi:hypothetical protein JN06_00496 [Bacteroides zoogleoformans]|nr:hypothetical protein JN06_00496 [Bacteroides zoogleoformans]
MAYLLVPEIEKGKTYELICENFDILLAFSFKIFNIVILFILQRNVPNSTVT